MYRPVRVAAPSTTPLTRAQVKAHLRVDFTDDDDLIDALIQAAVSHLDGWTGILGRCLMEQTWRQDYDAFMPCMRLPLYPVISVVSVKYDDVDGVEQTIAPSNYDLLVDGLGAFVRFDINFSFPTIDVDRPAAVRITYHAGEPGTDDSPAEAAVPAAITQGMLLAIGHWYANRENVVVGTITSPLPMACDALWAPYRRMRF
jgi:uncharacterized phiE125 gp8 family phage protein